MKKRIVLFSLLFIIVFLCSACNGTVTKDIRHDGFTVSSKFICDTFYPSNKNDTLYKKIKYLTNNNIIDSNGYIYEVSLGQVYGNDQNCKRANTDIAVKAIYDNKIFKGNDNKYYYLDDNNNITKYSLVLETDNSYELYNVLLKDEDVVKVITADSSRGIYYILKTDGNVYSYTITRADYSSPLRIISKTIVYDKGDYGSSIIDFNYKGESTSTYIKTEDSIYRMKITNYEKCSKYADVNCIYRIEKDDVLNKYKDRIIVFNGNTLITDYKQVFTIEE